MTTYAQADVEDLTRQVLAAEGCMNIPADTISDAVDIYLSRIERLTGDPLDRDAIDPDAAAQAVEDAAACIRARETVNHS